MAEHFDEFYLPFDSTGAAVTNFQSSQHTIIATGNGQYQQITPRYGIFFRDGLVITHVESNTELVMGRDYYLSYYARWMYDQYKKNCFSAIVLLNKTLVGNLNVSAHWVGGDFSSSLDGLIPALVNEQDVEKVMLWDGNTAIAHCFRMDGLCHDALVQAFSAERRVQHVAGQEVDEIHGVPPLLECEDWQRGGRLQTRNFFRRGR